MIIYKRNGLLKKCVFSFRLKPSPISSNIPDSDSCIKLWHMPISAGLRKTLANFTIFELQASACFNTHCLYVKLSLKIVIKFQ